MYACVRAGARAQGRPRVAFVAAQGLRSETTCRYVAAGGTLVGNGNSDPDGVPRGEVGAAAPSGAASPFFVFVSAVESGDAPRVCSSERRG